jgi:hypothetical protein
MRTWQPIRNEPTGDIEGVRDKDGDLWRPGRDSGWFYCGKGPEAWKESVDRVGQGWLTVLMSAPLREVTEAGEHAWPIMITAEIVQAIVDEIDFTDGSNAHAEVRLGLINGLRAAGYEVTQ